MSNIGIFSVIIHVTLIPPRRLSFAAPKANLAGTKIMLVSHSVSLIASLTVLKTGTLWISCPPFLGVTPATILVP